MCGSDELYGIIRCRGFLGASQVREALNRVPRARHEIVEWIEQSIDDGDSGRFRSLVNFATAAKFADMLEPVDLDRLIIPLVVNREEQYLLEDLVEILGELESVDAVEAVAGLFEERCVNAANDLINQSLCLKCIYALSSIDTDEARGVLRGIAIGAYPNILRWHAACQLDIDGELGFDKDEMVE